MRQHLFNDLRPLQWEQWGEEEGRDSGLKRGKCEGQVSKESWGVGSVLPSSAGLSHQGHVGAQAGSLAAHRMMASMVFSLEGEGGTEFSPSSSFSAPSSS